ncbi:MAG: hypothetical protein HN341_01715 [Verrucomicrobia bacterium]|nr:hypothetical protein [Verrucomicrobiota bacterium]
MTRMASISLLCVALITTGVEAASPGETGALDILFIGNSYTGNLRDLFNRFMAEAFPGSHLAYRTPGGWTLSRHVADPGVKEAITSRTWDYVVLQEQSRLPTFDPKSAMYREHRQAIRTLVEWISASGAAPILYETWGRRDGDGGSPKRSPDFDAMQVHLTRAYADAARETGARVIPVGQAWQAVRRTDIELGRALHAKDGSHASPKGSYLIAATFLHGLAKTDAATLHPPPGLTEQETTTIDNAITQTLSLN